MYDRFEMAAGSVTGHEHKRTGRNSQDAYCTFCGEDATIAVVCDGCGSGRHSEVGAKLAARLLVEGLRRCAWRLAYERPERVLESIREDVLTRLRTLAHALGGNLDQVVHDYFLFTILGVAVTPTVTVVFQLGDGTFAVNGESVTRSYPGNAPPYLGYALLAPRRSGSALESRFTIEAVIPTEALESVLIGSDGVEPLEDVTSFSTEDRYFRNAFALGRTLTRLNAESPRIDWDARRVERSAGLLADDTTLVVVRRRAPRALLVAGDAVRS